MITIFIRTLIIYVVLIGVMRIMGKRQVGELEVSDLVTTLILSEIATAPIADHNIPIIHAVIPIITLLSTEVIISVLITKSSKFKSLFGGRPSIIIKDGVLDQKELKNNRLSVDEILSELRQSDATNISDVKYAILEHNGRFSIVCGAGKGAPGIAHPIIIDGKISERSLSEAKKNIDWVNARAKDAGCRPEDIFLLSIDDAGTVNLIKKEK